MEVKGTVKLIALLKQELVKQVNNGKNKLS